GDKGIYPNLDFYSGVVMSSMGIDRELFTPVFAVSRVVGWVAHALEQRADNRIYRPRFVYVGPTYEDYVPIEKRGG
ncbi:MAG TPA: citrate synthase, partial [Anaerolineae bacterium]|nr:citrate synthase [Anaerolineae bacterium]